MTTSVQASETLEVESVDLDAEWLENNEESKNGVGEDKNPSERQHFSMVVVVSPTEGEAENLNWNESRPEDRKHMQLFEKLFDGMRLCLKILGLGSSYDYNFKRRPLLFLLIFSLAMMYVSLFYTQAIHYTNGDLPKVFEVCAMYGVTVSSSLKLIGWLTKRPHALSLLFFIRKICKEVVSGRRADILRRDLEWTMAVIKLFSMTMLLCVATFAFVPLYSYFVENELMSLLPMELPFVDKSTAVGFIIGNSHTLICASLAAVGMIMYSSVFIFSVCMYSTLISLIEVDLNDLDKLWATGECNEITLTYKLASMRNICMKRRDSLKYWETVKIVFEAKFKYYFIVSYVCQVISIFVITQYDWISGYPIALGLFTEMMFYCLMGSQIAVADDRMCQIIYNTNWYVYDKKSKVMLCMLLHQSQVLNELNIGVFGKLNIVTGIEVVKSCYSFYTYLTELL